MCFLMFFACVMICMSSRRRMISSSFWYIFGSKNRATNREKSFQNWTNHWQVNSKSLQDHNRASKVNKWAPRGVEALECAWSVLEVCLAGAWSVLEGCLGGVWSVAWEDRHSSPGPRTTPSLIRSLVSHTWWPGGRWIIFSKCLVRWLWTSWPWGSKMAPRGSTMLLGISKILFDQSLSSPAFNFSAFGSCRPPTWSLELRASKLRSSELRA